MTLNGVMAVAMRYFIEFGSFPGAYYVKVVEDTPTISERIFIAIFMKVTENECVMHRRSHVTGCHHCNITYLLLLFNSTLSLILP